MAGFQLAGKLAPLLSKALLKSGKGISSILGPGGASNLVRKGTVVGARNLKSPAMSSALDSAVVTAAPEALISALTGGLGAGAGSLVSSVGTQGILASLGSVSGVPKGVRDIANNPNLRGAAGQFAGGAVANLLTPRTRSLPSQTISPEQQLELAQLQAQAQMQGNQLSANSQDLLTALNAATALTGNAGSILNVGPYQVQTFDA